MRQISIFFFSSDLKNNLDLILFSFGDFHLTFILLSLLSFQRGYNIGVQNGWISMESFTQEWWELSFISLLGNLQQRELELGKGPADKPRRLEIELFLDRDSNLKNYPLTTVCIDMKHTHRGQKAMSDSVMWEFVFAIWISFSMLWWGGFTREWATESVI